MIAISILYRTVVEAIEAHTALRSAGARHRRAEDVPAILHTDHYAALRRVIDDAAAVVCLRLAAAGVGCRQTSNDFVTVPVADDSPLATDREAAREIVTQAVIWLTLHVAYSAAGLPGDYYARADALLAPWADAAYAPRRLTPW